MTSLDIIIPYVNNEDPEWQNTFLRAKGMNFRTDRAKTYFLKTFNKRFADYGLFKYWWRALDSNFKSLGKVHLLLQSASQYPAWLKPNDPRIEVHLHEEFLPEFCQPCYNSSCIELAALHQIPDLTENFLLLNDDMYFNAPTDSSDYIEGSRPLTHAVTRAMFRPINCFRSILCNDIELVNHITGRNCPSFEHGHLAICYNTEYIKEALTSNWPSIENSFTKFRNERNLNHWFLRYLQDFTGFSINSDRFPHRGYVEMHTLTSSDLDIKLRAEKIICVNDVHGNGVGLNLLCRYLADRYPNKSSFEL